MRRHRLDPFALVCGLLTVAATGAWAAWHADVVTSDQLALAGPVALIIVGIVGVATSLRKHAPTRVGEASTDVPQTEPTDDTDTDTDTEGVSR